MTRGEVQEMLLKEQSPLKKQALLDLLDKMDFFEREERPLINDLKNIEIKVESVWDLVNNRQGTHLGNAFIGQYEIAYPVLLKHLDFEYHHRIKEGIIRALTEKNAAGIATEKLLTLFYKEPDKKLKWVLANALKTLMTWRQRQKHPEIQEIWKGT